MMKLPAPLPVSKKVGAFSCIFQTVSIRTASNGYPVKYSILADNMQKRRCLPVLTLVFFVLCPKRASSLNFIEKLKNCDNETVWTCDDYHAWGSGMKDLEKFFGCLGYDRFLRPDQYQARKSSERAVMTINTSSWITKLFEVDTEAQVRFPPVEMGPRQVNGFKSSFNFVSCFY